MPSSGGPGIVKLPAVIYQGMFEGEVQVTANVNGDEINLIVSTDSVEIEGAPLDEKGVKGLLLAEIVDKTSEGLLIHLPGEVQGASNRMRYVA